MKKIILCQVEEKRVPKVIEFDGSAYKLFELLIETSKKYDNKLAVTLWILDQKSRKKVLRSVLSYGPDLAIAMEESLGVTLQEKIREARRKYDFIFTDKIIELATQTAEDSRISIIEEIGITDPGIAEDAIAKFEELQTEADALRIDAMFVNYDEKYPCVNVIEKRPIDYFTFYIADKKYLLFSAHEAFYEGYTERLECNRILLDLFKYIKTDIELLAALCVFSGWTYIGSFEDMLWFRYYKPC